MGHRSGQGFDRDAAAAVKGVTVVVAIASPTVVAVLRSNPIASRPVASGVRPLRNRGPCSMLLTFVPLLIPSPTAHANDHHSQQPLDQLPVTLRTRSSPHC